MAKRRRMSRQKKTALWIAGIGLAGGALAVYLWPEIKRKFLTPTVIADESNATFKKILLPGVINLSA